MAAATGDLGEAADGGMAGAIWGMFPSAGSGSSVAAGIGGGSGKGAAERGGAGGMMCHLMRVVSLSLTPSPKARAATRVCSLSASNGWRVMSFFLRPY